MIRYWVLDDHRPTPASLLEWAMFFEKSDRQIAKTEHAGVLISTVFLGIDHNFSDEGPPLLFETMVFGLGDYQTRSATWDEALSHHMDACKWTDSELARPKNWWGSIYWLFMDRRP